MALCLAMISVLTGMSPAKAELITGAGSTFAFPVIGQWAKAYRVAKTDGADFIPHDIGVDYEPIGSLGGEVRINQRGIDFGATDRPLSPAELERNGLGQFPIVMGGVIPVVNIDGVAPGQIKVTGALLADIFLGKVGNWSDPAIKAVNPELTLPDAKIAVVHRSDGSGTTFNFASYLAKASPAWREKIGADTLVRWPAGTGAEGNQGVANLVLRTKNAIGYVEYGQVVRASLAYALVQNRAGNFIKPDATSLQAAAAGADPREAVFAVPPPPAARRGPVSRFIVQPQLSCRLLRPLSTPVPPVAIVTGKGSSKSGFVAGVDAAPAAVLPHAAPPPTATAPVYEEVVLPLALEGITLQTQLTRCLGPIDGWLCRHTHEGSRRMLGDGLFMGSPSAADGTGAADTDALGGTLAEPLAAKYNMLHFTPVQALGGSHSAYSIANQHALDYRTFATNAHVRAAAAVAAGEVLAALRRDTSSATDPTVLPAPGSRLGAAVEALVASHPRVEAAKSAVLRRLVGVLEQQHGVLSMVDIVLNHTATSSPWLAAHPEAGYSLSNSPHLRAAFELDEAVLRVSAAIARGGVPGVTPAMASPGAVRAAVEVLQHHPSLGLPATRLWEFYVVDVAGTLGAAAGLHPDIVLGADACALLSDADNREGGDLSQPPPAPLHTAGVPPAPLSAERLHEIASCRHATVAAVLAAYRARGYAHGAGDGCVHISDADADRLAAALAVQAPPPTLEAAVTRLRQLPAATLARIEVAVDDATAAAATAAAGMHGAPSPAASSMSLGTPATSTFPPSPAAFTIGAPAAAAVAAAAPPVARPHLASIAASDSPVYLESPVPRLSSTAAAVAVGIGAFPFGRPPLPAHVSDVPGGAPVVTAIRAPSSPSMRGGSGGAGGDSGFSLVSTPVARARRNSWLQLGRPLLQYIKRHSVAAGAGGPPTPIHSALHSAASLRSVTGVSSPTAASPSVPATPAAVLPPPPPPQPPRQPLDGGVYNDGSGSRFAVHLDLERVIAALNTVAGIHIDPAAWLLPPEPGAAPAADADAAEWATRARRGSGSLGILPSLYLIQRIAHAVNATLFRRHDADIGAAVGAISGTAHYQWLTSWQGKRVLEEERPLVYSYFTRVPRHDGAVSVLACNGFIWNGDPEIDFTLPVDAAHAYAALVRAGTAQVAYIKRPRAHRRERGTTGNGNGNGGGGGGGGHTGGVGGSAARGLGAWDLPPDWQLLAQEAAEVAGTVEAFRTLPLSHLRNAAWARLVPTTSGAATPGSDAARRCATEASAAVAAAVAAAGGGKAGGRGATPEAAHDPSAAPLLEPALCAAIDSVPHLRPDAVGVPLVTASTPYMRRDVVIWGDCVKLRYGLAPQDSPWLWWYMRVYVQRMAAVFHSVRLDNAHGTPLHVAAAMIDAARLVRPQLYVNAELFTGSLERDVEYVSRIGINSLVREAMAAASADDMVRSLYSYGGTPIGSLRPILRGTTIASRIQSLLPPSRALPLVRRLLTGSQSQLSVPELHLLDAATAGGRGSTGALLPPPVQPPRTARRRAPLCAVNGLDVNALPRAASAAADNDLAPLDASSKAPAMILQRVLVGVNEMAVCEVLPAPLPALFFDCTHDNEVPATKRHPADAVATAALVAIGVCATGSTRGYDDFVPHNVSVVTDWRLYARPGCVAAEYDASDEARISRAPCLVPFDGSGGGDGVPLCVDLYVGMRRVRRRLNLLKQEMAAKGHTEVYVTSVGAPCGTAVVTVVRGHPSLPSSYALIARTAPSAAAAGGWQDGTPLPEVQLEGRGTGVLLAAAPSIVNAPIGTPPPVGPLGVTPSAPSTAVLGGAAAATATAEAADEDGVVWRDGVSGGGMVDTAVGATWNAHPHYINGLPSSLAYTDNLGEAPPPSSLETAALGMAAFTEVDATGGSGGGAVGVCTRVRLTPRAFVPGAVLVLKLQAPRNVSIRAQSARSGGGVVGGGGTGGGGGSMESGMDGLVPADALDDTPVSLAAGVPLAALMSSSGHHPPSLSRGGMPAALSIAPPVHAASAPSAAAAAVTDPQWRAMVAAISFALHGPSPDANPARALHPTSSLAALLDGTPPRRRASSGGGGTGSVLLLAGDDAAPGSARSIGRFGSVPRPPPASGTGSVFFGPPLSELEAALLTNPDVSLLTLNGVLYRCDAEERDASGGHRGVYVVPGMGALPWAGVAGFAQTLRHCRKWNDLGHPLLDNIRRGPWLMDYCVARLGDVPGAAGVASWMERHFAILRRLPTGLQPQGFDRIVTAVYHVAVAAALARMDSVLLPAGAFTHSQHYLVSVSAAAAGLSGEAGGGDDSNDGDDDEEEDSGGDDDGDDGDDVGDGGGGGGGAGAAGSVVQARVDPAAPLPFVTALALTSVQLFGAVASAPLLATAQRHLMVSGGEYAGCMAAGVPHFATGFMRAWGRDTFIAFRGLLLVTGRFEEARATLLAFAAQLRHGLLPNLMDGGSRPRYNCRDAVWWWAQAVQDYCTLAPEGVGVLSARVRRRWPSDNPSDYDGDGRWVGDAAAAAREWTVVELLVEALAAHARGIAFREWGAGRGLDEHMRDEGFNVSARVDAATGFVHGGNVWNCGTWMDKMGESGRHGTDGVPATPRDGAAVEIVALSYSALAWLAGLEAAGTVPPTSFVFSSTGEAVSATTWAGRIAAAFDVAFYVPMLPSDDGAHAIDARYVSTRGMYKDTVGSTAGWPDYQVRPNVAVALAVAPHLFPPVHADAALVTLERHLLGDGQLGMKTLSPRDWAYRGVYNNDDESERATARGWNYHNGPEWLWPVGYYLRARLAFPPGLAREHLAAVRSTGGGATSLVCGGGRAGCAACAAAAWPSYAAMRRWMAARTARARRHLETAPDAGLPELTNAGGAPCRFSCTSQAWSSATLLDALYDLHCLRR